MAHFYTSARGNGREVTRVGAKESGARVTIGTHQFEVSAHASHYETRDHDTVWVEFTDRQGAAPTMTVDYRNDGTTAWVEPNVAFMLGISGGAWDTLLREPQVATLLKRVLFKHMDKLP